MKLQDLLENHFKNGEKLQDTYEVLELLNSDYSEAWKAFKEGKKLFRGLTVSINAFDSPFVSSTTDADRLSMHAAHRKKDSIYNSLFSKLLPSWKLYPKRNKSIICSNTYMIASDYGNVYHVFPINGTILGECPSYDLWFSFDNALKDVRNLLYKICIELDEHKTKENIMINNSITSLQHLDVVFTVIQKIFNITEDELLSKIVDGKKLIDHLDDLLDPDQNKFKKISISEIDMDKKHEYWFSGTCLYIDRISLKELI